MMVRSPALNPASVPFYPPGMTRTDDAANEHAEAVGGSAGARATTPSGLGFRNRSFTPQDAEASTTTLTTSPVDERAGSSVASSGDRPNIVEVSSASNDAETASVASSGRSTGMGSTIPTPLAFRAGTHTNPYIQQSSNIIVNGNTSTDDMRSRGELTIADKSADLADGEDTPGPLPIQQWAMRTHTPGQSAYVHDQAEFPSGPTQVNQEQQHHNHHAPPPVNPGFLNMNVAARPPAFSNPFKSPSPVSSIGSASVHTSSMDFHHAPSFDAQLRASPAFRELLDRLTRCEMSNNAVQKELEIVHRSVNILIERTLAPSAINGEPEFKNPFASNAGSRSLTPSGGIGPLQQTPPHPSMKNDELSQISQRINTLTSSVGQLLALQTQHHMGSISHALGAQQGQMPPQPPMDIAPNQTMVSPSQASLLPLGIPNRPDLRPSPRMPNPPMRTWSAGTLDLPARLADVNLGRQDNVIRDKRRSVVSLVRRDSSGMTDISENWSSRDSGPLASKWDQLPLSPDLLRSLNKFGVGPPNKIQQRALPFLLKGSDIIAQAPPTQERIAAYVIPAINVAVVTMATRPVNRGPIVVMISTTVDQATQAQRMIRDLGGPIGIRSALGVGATGPNSGLAQELQLLQQATPHIICGTPQKLHALFTAPGGLSGAEVRFLVLDEVDQLIARNLHEYVFNIVKLLPAPRSRAVVSPGTSPSNSSTASSQFNPLDSTVGSLGSPFQNTGRRFSAVSSNAGPDGLPLASQPIERQTALFSNTVPQDVLNLANAIQLREPVRVLVRRDGNVTQAESNQGARGLRQFYLYLAFTAGGRADPSASAGGGGLGIIGSGRGASSAETAQAREWKLDALVDLLEDLDVPQIIVHVGGMTALDAVVYKLASRGFEAVPLHGDMNAGTKLAALNKFRGQANMPMRQTATKVLIVYDVQVKAPDVFQVPLVINYDLPQAVEEYAHRVAPAISTNHSRAGVVVNFVTATGGDVEMLRSIECFYKIKCPEVPTSLRELL